MLTQEDGDGRIRPRYRLVAMAMSTLAAVALTSLLDVRFLFSTPRGTLDAADTRPDAAAAGGSNSYTQETKREKYGDVDIADSESVRESGRSTNEMLSLDNSPVYSVLGESLRDEDRNGLAPNHVVADTRHDARYLRLLSDTRASDADGITHEGEGGTLKDGRNRCFKDEEGKRRCYPTVFFLGTSKCATTSLARWLDNHPMTYWVANPRRPHQVEQTGVKEAHVFDDPPKGSREAHQIELHNKLFITAPKVNAEDVVIDYTPHYLAVAETPYRIKDMYGKYSGLKFIVTIREPAARSISSWEFKNMFNDKKGRREERRTLAKTASDGMTRAGKLVTCVENSKAQGVFGRELDLKRCNPRQFLEMPLFISHVGKSMYALQLERWFSLFGRESFKVIFTDDMAINPVGVLQDVLDFLGLEFTSDDPAKGLPDVKRWHKITGMAYNKTKSQKKSELATQVTDEIKDTLRSFFEPHNRQLERLLGFKVPDSWN